MAFSGQGQSRRGASGEEEGRLARPAALDMLVVLERTRSWIYKPSHRLEIWIQAFSSTCTHDITTLTISSVTGAVYRMNV